MFLVFTGGTKCVDNASVPGWGIMKTTAVMRITGRHSDMDKKRTIAIFFLAGALIMAGVWVFAVGGESSDKKTAHITAGIRIKNADIPGDFSKDSDGDGLRDWEEELAGMDPRNPDTNGNGVSDGDEAMVVAPAGAGAPFGAPAPAGEEYAGDITQGENPPQSTSTVKANPFAGLPPKPVLFRAEFSQETPKSVTIMLKGTGFTEKNTVRAGFQNFYDVPSENGTSITVVFAPNIPENKPGVVSNLPFAIYVDNKNGLSNPLLFTLVNGKDGE